MHFAMRMDDVPVVFLEEIEFLVQTISLQFDDEFVSYIFRYTSDINEKLNKNFTATHPVFKELP